MEFVEQARLSIQLLIRLFFRLGTRYEIFIRQQIPVLS